jgi:hypothetical protein
MIPLEQKRVDSRWQDMADAANDPTSCFYFLLLFQNNPMEVIKNPPKKRNIDPF